MIILKNGKNYLIDNPKIVQGYNCYICRRPATNQHHIVYGRGKRQISDREKLTVALCNECHRKLHHYHYYDRELKAMAQEIWLANHNGDRKRWYSLFYKFYDL